MQWQSVEAFLAMGGYGFYVWSSFGITFLLMAIEIIVINQRRKSAANAVKQSEF